MMYPRPYQVLYQRLCIFLYLWCVSCCIALRITHCIGEDVSGVYLVCICSVSSVYHTRRIGYMYQKRIVTCIVSVSGWRIGTSVPQTYRSTYRGCIRKTYHRTRIARVSHYVSHAYQAYVSSHVYRERIWYRIRAYQCLYLQRRDICVAACISDSIRVYRQCIGYMYRDVS